MLDISRPCGGTGGQGEAPAPRNGGTLLLWDDGEGRSMERMARTVRHMPERITVTRTTRVRKGWSTSTFNATVAGADLPTWR